MSVFPHQKHVIVLNVRIFEYFQNNFLISVWQSGFIHGHSTVTHLVEMYHTFCQSVSSGKEIRVVFCDVSRAFDRVWHKGLLFKLEKCGITGSLLAWLKRYLQERYQLVLLNGQMSPWELITAGVPQGSVLGPLLFLIYLNDITHIIKKLPDKNVCRWHFPLYRGRKPIPGSSQNQWRFGSSAPMGTKVASVIQSTQIRVSDNLQQISTRRASTHLHGWKDDNWSYTSQTCGSNN